MKVRAQITKKEIDLVGRSCLCLPIQRAARVIGRRFDEALRPLDITNWQFSLLMNLGTDTPPSIGALAEALAMDRTTITANLKPLERRGLVTVLRDEKDGRSRRVVLTRAGVDLLTDAYAIWRKVNSEATRKLADIGLADFHLALNTISEQ